MEMDSCPRHPPLTLRNLCCCQPNDFPTVPADGSYTGSVGLTYTSELDLATGAVSEVVVTNTQHDMFCPGARFYGCDGLSRPVLSSGALMRCF